MTSPYEQALYEANRQSKNSRHALRDPETGSWTTPEKLAAKVDYKSKWADAVVRCDYFIKTTDRESKRADRLAIKYDNLTSDAIILLWILVCSILTNIAQARGWL